MTKKLLNIKHTNTTVYQVLSSSLAKPRFQ